MTALAVDDHSHCELCINRKCHEGCPMMSCNLFCDAIFHWCKQSEHEKLCPNARVPCINQDNGCPHVMVRHDLGIHLSKCPASVISCTSEWNRSAVHINEHCVRPLDKADIQTKFCQLDLALALRDQRCVNGANNTPLTTPGLQGENLKQLFRCKPLVFPDGNRPVLQFSDDATLASHHFSRVSESPASDSISQVNTMSQSSLSAIQSSNCNMANTDNAICGDEQSHHEISSNDNQKCNLPEMECSSMVAQIACLGLDLTIDSITHFQINPHSTYTFLCAEILRRDEYPWHVRNIHADIYSGLNGWLEQRCPLACYGCTFSIRRMYPNNAGSQVVYNSLLESFGLQPDIPDILCQNKASDCTSCNTNAQSNDCSDPESDVSGVSCDCSKLGPGASQLRCNNCDLILASSQLECDHTNKESDTSKSDCDHTSLIDLPVEVLERVTLFLDGFSLNNLAFTCTLLRDVCSNILPEKGVVLQQWSSQLIQGKKHWFLADNLWMFTNAMSAILSWELSDEVFKMAQHLHACAFNTKLVRTDPYRVIITECPQEEQPLHTCDDTPAD